MNLNSYNYLIKLRQKYRNELQEGTKNNNKQQVEFCKKQIELIEDRMKSY